MSQEKQKWVVLEDEDCIHILPEFDKLPHSAQKEGETRDLSDLDCPCRPKADFGGGKPMIVHNSFIDQEKIDSSINNLSTPPPCN